MPEPLSRQQASEKLDALLHCSVRRYEDILTLLAAINSDVGGNNAATLDSRGTEVLQLQEQAALADCELVTTLQEMHIDVSDHPLIDKRLEIMQQIMSHNRSLLSSVHNVKSLLAHEIKEMQGGQAALHGYRQTTSSQNGGILKGAL